MSIYLKKEDKILAKLVEAPKGVLDDRMRQKLKDLIGKPDEEVKVGLRYVLDASAHCALASDFIMQVLNILWESLGGKMEDGRTFMP